MEPGAGHSERDVFRYSLLRYLGYANEVGEAFRHVVAVRWVYVSYAVASGYVAAHSVQQGYRAKKHRGSESLPHVSDVDIDVHTTCPSVAVLDTLLWQGLASVLIPGFTINRICALSRYLLDRPLLLLTPLLSAPAFRMWAVTGVGLGAIPFIIGPIDSRNYCVVLYYGRFLLFYTLPALLVMAMPLSSRWEELRKESRRLENDIDLKLVSFSKLGSSYSHRDSRSAWRSESSSVGLGGSGHVFDTLALEIEQLLAKLRQVNGAMNEYVSSLNSTTPTTSLYHTLQRHNEILQDYSQEFNRTKSNILAQRQREELLGTSRKDGYKGSALNRRTELYLKEHEHIRGSDKAADEAISIAISTKENLSHQRDMFTGITTRVTSMTTRFPLINSLVQKISLRKRRDSLILGGVIAVCVIILLLLAFR